MPLDSRRLCPHAAACAAAATAAGASQLLSFFSFFLFVSESLALQPSPKPGTVPLNLCWQGRRQGRPALRPGTSAQVIAQVHVSHRSSR